MGGQVQLPELGETFVYLCGVMMGFMAFLCICSKPLPLYLRETPTHCICAKERFSALLNLAAPSNGEEGRLHP